MSIKTVNKQIQQAINNDPQMGCFSGKTVDGKEANKIVETAEKGWVTNGEGKAIGDLFDRQLAPPAPGMMVTMACPENPNSVGLTKDANKTFNQFFVQHDLPFGENKANVTDRIKTAIATDGYGPDLACEPKGLKHMTKVFTRDKRPVDGDMVEAFFDAKKGEAYIRATGAGMAGPHTIGPFWHGPIKLPPQTIAPKVSADRQAELRTAFKQAGNLEYNAPTPPIGQQYVRVPLSQQPGFDTYQFTALIPTGATAPGAPQKDPNDVDTFFVERSGGFAGLTQVAGPIKLGETAPQVQLPPGMLSMKAEVLSTFGGIAPQVSLSGGLNNPSWSVSVAKPKIDAATNTVTIALSTKQGEGFYPDVVGSFEKMVSLPHLASSGGEWTINITDKKGKTLESLKLDQNNWI